MTKQRQFRYAATAGVAFTGLLVAAACIPHCDFFSYGLLPGGLLAALVFPAGIESGDGFTYLFLAGLIDIALYGSLAFLFIFLRSTKTNHNQ